MSQPRPSPLCSNTGGKLNYSSIATNLIFTMRVIYAFTICLAIVWIAESKSQIKNEEESDIRKLYADLEKRFAAMELKLANIEKEGDKSADASLLNDTNLEERVQALEFQMENVHEDITVIGGEISVINSEQDLQDTQIQQIENDIVEIQSGLEVITGTVTELTAVTDDLQTSVVSLQETDAGLTEDITQLTETDGELDSRLSQLEVDEAVAFHAALGTYSTIPIESIMVFDNVNVNLGGGYNSSTGQFTTPSGGARFYYFYVHVLVDHGKWVWMNIRHNGVTVAIMAEDEFGGDDNPAASCGAVIMMQEGNNLLTCDMY